MACSLQYVVVVVDGRGTGYKGRKLRNPVKDNLGYWETQDQINAAKSVPVYSLFPVLMSRYMFTEYGLLRTMWTLIVLAYGDGWVASLKYAIPSDFVTVQSYGGFMSSKVVEANAGIHTLAMAVAVRLLAFYCLQIDDLSIHSLSRVGAYMVSGCLAFKTVKMHIRTLSLTDSIYTERYMNVPSVNPSGYVTASISNVTGFHNVDFLLAHGSGDDNVHFANSAHLLDMFTADKVRNFEFRMFTDRCVCSLDLDDAILTSGPAIIASTGAVRTGNCMSS